MQDRKKHLLSLALWGGLMGLTIYLFLKGNSLSELAAAFQNIDLRYVGLGLLMMLCFICCEAVNNTMILKTMDYRLKPLQALKYAMIGFYFSSITPSSTGGQPAQVYFMKRDGIQVGHSSLSLLVMVMFYQIAMLGSALVLFLCQGALIKASFGGVLYLVIYGAAVNLILICCIGLMIFRSGWVRKTVMGIVHFLHRIKILKNEEKWAKLDDKQISQYRRGAGYIRKNPKLMVKVLVVTVIQINVMYLVPFAVYKAFGLGGKSILAMLAIQALLNIAVSSVPLPGAAGASELGFMSVFALFFPSQLILPAMLIWRGITYYFYLGVGALVTTGVQFFGKKATQLPS